MGGKLYFFDRMTRLRISNSGRASHEASQGLHHRRVYSTIAPLLERTESTRRSSAVL